jgi:hypothetical protein
MTHNVIRTFGIDYIFFDLVFLFVFHFLMIRNRKIIPLVAFWLGGLAIFIIDWGFWMQVSGIRKLELPPSFLPFLPEYWRVFTFMFWFSFSYGLMFSWMFLMFEPKGRRIFWTVLLWGGWLTVAFLSQYIHLNDGTIQTLRMMGGSRITQIIIAAGGFILLFILRYNWKMILYLFCIGFMTHFMMESSLWLSGIRPGNLSVLLINSLIESNMGVPILYVLYDKVLKRRKMVIGGR